MIVINLIYK